MNYRTPTEKILRCFFRKQENVNIILDISNLRKHKIHPNNYEVIAKWSKPEGVTDISRQFAGRDVPFHVVEKLAEFDVWFDRGQKAIAFVGVKLKAIPLTEIKFSRKENKIDGDIFETLTSIRFCAWSYRFWSPRFQAGVGNCSASDENSS